MSRSSPSSWFHLLDCTERGPRSTIANIVKVLQADPLWSPDIVHYDEFLDRVLVRNGDAREWTDADDVRLVVYLQEAVGMTSTTVGQVKDAVNYVCTQHRKRHAVRDYLVPLPWDHVPRIDHALEDIWGCDTNAQQPCAYLRAVSKNFLIAIVARVMRPGCQVDEMVVFEGPQGIGKSKALRELGGPWYMLAAESVLSKDFFQSLPGKLIVEIGEMDAFSRAERERVKLAISTPVDRYRVSFGRRATDHPRQCVFAGTTNRDDYGNDDTGLRRFLPVRCGDINLPLLAEQRDQLFAEAYARFTAGESWWETPLTDTRAVQRDRQAEDVWTSTVLEWAAGKSSVTITDVLAGALKFKDAEMGRVDQLRVGSILRLAGWEKQTVRRDGRVVKAWTAPENVTLVDVLSV